jgi:hypothetical protein
LEEGRNQEFELLISTGLKERLKCLKHSKRSQRPKLLVVTDYIDDRYYRNREIQNVPEVANVGVPVVFIVVKKAKRDDLKHHFKDVDHCEHNVKVF